MCYIEKVSLACLLIEGRRPGGSKPPAVTNDDHKSPRKAVAELKNPGMSLCVIEGKTYFCSPAGLGARPV